MGSRVLDIGCNDGSMGVLLNQKKQCLVYGVDVVHELVHQAEKRGVLAKIGCAEDVCHPDEKFDAVVMAETLEHLYDPREGLAEAKRVLKKGGVFVGSVPHPDGKMGREHETGGDYHQTIFEVQDLRDLLLEFFPEANLVDTIYNEAYSIEEGIEIDQPQWINFKCLK